MYISIRRKTIFLIILSVTFGILLSQVIKIYASYDKKELPIIMYHSILRDKNYTGKYVVTPESLEEDIKYLKEKGYKSVLPSELVEYAKGNKDLPEKTYMITLDDGSYNNLTYLLPILEKYDECALINIVGKYTESFSDSGDTNPQYSYLKWEDIDTLLNSGRIEIGNHSYNFHSQDKRNGAKINKNEDIDLYKRMFFADTKKTEDMLNINNKIKPIVYAYPFGAYSVESEDVLSQMGYYITLTCEEGINEISDLNSLKKLKRFNRSGFLTTYEFFKKCKIL